MSIISHRWALLKRLLAVIVVSITALDEFALLPGIAAVDNAVGRRKEALDDGKLLIYALVRLQPYAEARRQHGQSAQRPAFPLGRVVLGIFQFAQVAEGPGHLVAIALQVALALACGTQHVGYVACDAWLFGDADYHTLCGDCQGCMRKKRKESL